MSIASYWKHSAVLVGLVWAIIGTSPAGAAELPPYEFDPVLSLTGDCSTSAFDPVSDPSCPYPPPPAGPVLNNCTPPGPTQVCTSRFREPRTVAIDPFGNEYVGSFAESDDEISQIDVFDDEGRFLTELAAPPAKSIAVDSKGNLYVFDDATGKIVRYPPSKYEPEVGKIAYANPAVPVSAGSAFGAIAIDAETDQLFVVRSGTITRYKSAAEGNGVLESFEPAGIGVWTEAIAVDAQRRRIYVGFCKNEAFECGIKVIGADAPHTFLKDIEGPNSELKFAATQGRLGLAVDEETGDFFVADVITAKTIFQFDESYEALSDLKSNEFQANVAIQIAVSNGEVSLSAEPCEERVVPLGDACNRHYLFVPAFKINGRAMAFAPPAQAPPEIEGVSSTGIGETEAGLEATIDPNGLETEYRFELTTQDAFEAEGFEGAAILGAGTIDSDSLATEVSTFATGLAPGQTYRFRAAAENELGSAPEEGQNETVFATYNDAVSLTPCANQALRFGLSGQLPDCRSYELVTPADTNGRPPKGVGFGGYTFNTIESNPAGDAVSFKIEGGSLPDSSGVGSFEGDPYLATRGSSGWSAALAGSIGDEATVADPGSTSLDQHYSFFLARQEGPLVIGGPTGYLRYPDGHPELIGRGSLGTDPRAPGMLITEDASHVLFATVKFGPAEPIQLEPNAPPTGTAAVYDRTIDPLTGAEETHVVSVLPGDITPAAGQNATYIGASKDGEGVAFAIGNKLYLRVGNETTSEIGENVTFAGVSEGGERIFYVEGGDLEAFDTSSEEVLEFTTSGGVTPVNVASGGTRAYFVSAEAIGGSSPNPLGAEPQGGEQNLYLSEEGAISFVATVTERDVEGTETSDHIQFDGLGLWTEAIGQPARDPSRTNPDGSVLLFQSRAEITGFEESEFPQIYRYDSDEGRLHCISCIPTGVPGGGASLQSYTFDSLDPPPLTPNGFVPGLTPDGRRVFFESDEALVSDDTDGVKDVYEWEEEEVGSCERPGGCVYLISSGQSARDNFLYAHSQNGDDVFFTTDDALTGFDTGEATSIYDARVGGGFPEPSPEEPCLADGCRPGMTPAPVFEKPRAGGDGDVPAKPKTCPKGKRKVKQSGKVRCVKKKKKKQKAKGGNAKQRAGADRGMGK